MPVFDLSHPLRPGMPSYPGLPEPKFHVLLKHGQPPLHANYASGTSFQIAAYEFGGNTGTYVDAPFHRHPDGMDFASLPLQKLVDLPGLLIDGPHDGPIHAQHFADLEVNGRAVLVHTGWASRWDEDYFHSGPYLTATAAEHLAMAGAALVGIDCANIDNMQDPARPAHTILLAAGIPIVESLCDLEQLAGKQFRFFAAPPAVHAGTSFPVRAFAIAE